MGIEETEKLIEVLEGDILNLFQIDYERVVSELDDLDLSEKMRLMVSLGEAALKIMTAISGFGLRPGLELFAGKK